MITRPDILWQNGLPDGRIINSCLWEHAGQVGRLNRLRAYYDGRHQIDFRQRASGLPNSQLSHGFPRYICTMAAGYLIGNPVGYIPGLREQENALEAVLDKYRACAIDSVDAELARDASIYGKGIELVFSDAQANPRSAVLDPRRAFVVYDESVEAKPLFGIHFSPRRKADGEPDGYRVSVYTADKYFMYETSELAKLDTSEPVDVRRHYFGGVPLVEYWNDEDERGDFEGVISLIDAYDLLESDRMNDKQQFVDALLLLYGCTLETDALGRSPGQQLREDKALSLPDSDARAEWLSKQLNEADTEVLRTAICQDIHKLSMVPDMTDQNFAGNSSGVAMRYKLLGLEQLTKTKERWFKEALKTRLRLFACFMGKRGAPPLDTDKVELVFTRSLPVNELELAQTLSTLKGILPEDKLDAMAAQFGGGA